MHNESVCYFCRERPDVDTQLVAVDFLPPHILQRQLMRVATMMAAGQLQPLTQAAYSMSSVVAAMRLLAQASHVGKVRRLRRCFACMWMLACYCSWPIVSALCSALTLDVCIGVTVQADTCNMGLWFAAGCCRWWCRRPLQASLPAAALLEHTAGHLWPSQVRGASTTFLAAAAGVRWYDVQPTVALVQHALRLLSCAAVAAARWARSTFVNYTTRCVCCNSRPSCRRFWRPGPADGSVAGSIRRCARGELLLPHGACDVSSAIIVGSFAQYAPPHACNGFPTATSSTTE